MKIILTGPIGSGKSTVVRAGMPHLGWTHPAGFFTHWNNQPRGAPTLYAETWSGEKITMAHRCDLRDPRIPHKIPYVLEPRFIPFVQANLTLGQPAQPIVVDELGLIELTAKPIIAAFAAVFLVPNPMLIVIQQRALKNWLNYLPANPAPTIVEVTPENRAALPARLATYPNAAGSALEL